MKKLIATVLLAAMMTAAIASCSGGAGETKQTEAVQAGETAEAEKEAETTAEYRFSGKTYDGEDFCVAAVNNTANPTWKASSFSEIIADEQNGEPINDGVYMRNKAVEELFGITLSPFDFSKFAEIGNEYSKIILSGDDIIDIGLCNGSSLPKMMTGGLLMDMNTLPNIDFGHTWWDQNSKNEFNIKNRMFAVTGDLCLSVSYAPIVYFFNKKLVSDYNLGNLYDEVRSGKWTLDKMFTMAETVAGDLNGNGEVDIGDTFGMLSEPASLVYMVRAGGQRLTKKNSEGIPEIVVSSERTATLVEKCGKFMTDKNINMFSTNFTGYSNVFFELFLPTFVDNRALFYNNQLLVALNLRDMDGDFGILPPPKYDENQENYRCPTSDWWATYVTIPMTNIKFEMTADILEGLGYYSQQYVTAAYIDTTVLSKAIRDDDSAEMIRIIFDNRDYDLGSIYDWGTVNSMFSSLTSGASGAFATAYAKAESKIQAAMEKTLEELG